MFDRALSVVSVTSFSLAKKNFIIFRLNREKIILVEPNSSSINVNFCQKTGLIAAQFDLHWRDIAYSFETICPGGNIFELISEG